MWRMSSAPTSDWISITENPLSPDELSNWVIRPNCGAVVTFSANSVVDGDALKASVPMWKRELWEGGSAWSDETSPIGNARDQ
jgi:molybdopterin synthase catalytic subunit